MVLEVVVPSPSSPSKLYPQAQTEPSDFTATVWLLPAATATTLDRSPPFASFTDTTDVRSNRVPSPSWPKPLFVAGGELSACEAGDDLRHWGRAAVGSSWVLLLHCL